MSLLWSGSNKMKLLTKTKHQKPSPTYPDMNIVRGPARDLGVSQDDDVSRRILLPRGFLGGTSLSASFSKGVAAGMTVEASIVLPLFLFFFLNLGCAIEMIRLHGNLELALWQIGSQLAIYGYALDSGETPDDAGQAEEDGDRWWDRLTGVAVASTYVKSQMVRAAGEEYLASSPLADGADSLQFLGSEIFGGGDEIDIVVTYAVSPLIGMAGFSPFRMANRYYAHIWNGYQLPGEEVQMVFITETGTVYHLNRDCTYLQLSSRQVAAAGIEEERNRNGSRYQACLRCADGAMPEMLYITDEGTRYHYRSDCSGLRRTVYSVSVEEAAEEGYHACARCGR